MTLLLVAAPASARPHGLTTWARYEHWHLSRTIEANDLRHKDLLKVLPSVHREIWEDWQSFDKKWDAAEYVAPAPSYGGSCTLAYIAEHESHNNYDAVNPTSGAYGKYQILPSTGDAYGCDLSTHQGQEACARTIYAARGSQPWAVC